MHEDGRESTKFDEYRSGSIREGSGSPKTHIKRHEKEPKSKILCIQTPDQPQRGRYVKIVTTSAQVVVLASAGDAHLSVLQIPLHR